MMPNANKSAPTYGYHKSSVAIFGPMQEREKKKEEGKDKKKKKGVVTGGARNLA